MARILFDGKSNFASGISVWRMRLMRPCTPGEIENLTGELSALMYAEWRNVSELELWWTTPSVLAFFITLILVVWSYRTFQAIRDKIEKEPVKYRSWGPRWNFTLLLFLAMLVFLLAWPIGIGIGVVAMLTPPPVVEANRTAANWFAILFIFRDICFVSAQGLIWAALRALAEEPVLPRQWRF